MPSFWRSERCFERSAGTIHFSEICSQPCAQRNRCFVRACIVSGASSRDTRYGSETMRRPATTARIDESMSSVSMKPCILNSRSSAVRQ